MRQNQKAMSQAEVTPRPMQKTYKPVLLIALMVACCGNMPISAQPTKAQATESITTEVNSADSAKTERIIRDTSVQIRGSGTSGSGVIVEKAGNVVTIATAWHVVSSQREGEEVYAITNDGRSHTVSFDSIRRIGDLDLALASFSTQVDYRAAEILTELRHDPTNSLTVFVAGYPVKTQNSLRITKGFLEANTDIGIDSGYQMLYSASTETGMSGGGIFTTSGQLAGIHGRGERDQYWSEYSMANIKTGINQGIPIKYLSLFKSNGATTAKQIQPKSSDDFAVSAQHMLRADPAKAYEYATRAVALKPTFFSQLMKAAAGFAIWHTQDAGKNPLIIESAYNSAQEAVRLFESLPTSRRTSRLGLKVYISRGIISSMLNAGNPEQDFTSALKYDPEDPGGYAQRGMLRFQKDDMDGAYADLKQSLRIDPMQPQAAIFFALTLEKLGRMDDALRVFDAVIRMDPRNTFALKNRGRIYLSGGSAQEGCKDLALAASMGDMRAKSFLLESRACD